MNKVLTLTAVAEAAIGILLIVVPSLVGELLLGAELFGVAAVVGRVAGVALFTLGIACWLARTDALSRAARGLVVAMLFYNFTVAALLVFAGLCLGMWGVMLWPAAILHAVMTIWCVVVLSRKLA